MLRARALKEHLALLEKRQADEEPESDEEEEGEDDVSSVSSEDGDAPGDEDDEDDDDNGSPLALALELDPEEAVAAPRPLQLPAGALLGVPAVHPAPARAFTIGRNPLAPAVTRQSIHLLTSILPPVPKASPVVQKAQQQQQKQSQGFQTVVAAQTPAAAKSSPAAAPTLPVVPAPTYVLSSAATPDVVAPAGQEIASMGPVGAGVSGVSLQTAKPTESKFAIAPQGANKTMAVGITVGVLGLIGLLLGAAWLYFKLIRKKKSRLPSLPPPSAPAPLPIHKRSNTEIFDIAMAAAYANERNDYDISGLDEKQYETYQRLNRGDQTPAATVRRSLNQWLRITRTRFSSRFSEPTTEGARSTYAPGTPRTVATEGGWGRESVYSRGLGESEPPIPPPPSFLRPGG